MTTFENNSFKWEYTYNKTPQLSKNLVLDELATNYNKKVNDTLSYNATKELANIFWVDNQNIHKQTKKDINGLSNNYEINNVEAKLAAMFWDKTYNKMLDLASKQEQQPISYASVLENYDEHIEYWELMS